MTLAGKYEFVKDENMAEHFKSLMGDNFPKNPPPNLPKRDAPLEIIISGDKVSVITGDDVKNYVLNQSVEDKMGPRTFNVTAKLDGSVLTLDYSNDSGVQRRRTLALNGSELVHTITSLSKAGVPDGKKFYKKL